MMIQSPDAADNCEMVPVLPANRFDDPPMMPLRNNGVNRQTKLVPQFSCGRSDFSPGVFQDGIGFAGLFQPQEKLQPAPGLGKPQAGHCLP
jgi:hypothetical protein